MHFRSALRKLVKPLQKRQNGQISQIEVHRRYTGVVN